MRRLVFSIIVASGLVMIGAGPASAEAAPTAAAAKAVPGKKMCKIGDPKLDEVSGLVATKSGYVVINDSTNVPTHKRVFFLDDNCQITKSVPFSGQGPRDTEDMVLSADGTTLWIADAGDNSYTDAARQRKNIGIWTMSVTGTAEPKIHRLSYPAGEHYDSEALLLTGNNTPLIVTKEAGRPAAFYEPTAALKTNNEIGVPMKKVGEFQPPETDTAGSSLARLLRKTVTGAAIAPGGAKVVLRTYTDAYEWDVAGGDVLAAVKTAPRKTPLENEPFGEAITYSPDGNYFYTTSDMQGATDTTGGNANYILRYTPVAKVVTASTKGAGGDTGSGGSAWYKNLTLDDITYIVSGVGLLGVILVGFGIFGIMRTRKKPLEPASKLGDGGPSGPKPTDAQTELLAVGGPPGRADDGQPGQRPGVYGGANRTGAAQQAGVYGGKPAPASPAAPPASSAPPAPSAPQRGGVYGGQPGGPGQGGGRPAQPEGRPPQGGGGRPGQPGGRPPEGRQPTDRPGGGVYGGAPPPPSASGRGGGGGYPAQHPSGFHSQGEPYGRRQAGTDMIGYADAHGRSHRQHFENPGYGR
jgi:hypothetical protein